MFCNKCGYQYEGYFCPKCGAKAKIPTAPVEQSVLHMNVSNVNDNIQTNTEPNPFDVYYNTGEFDVPGANQTEQANQQTAEIPYEPQYNYQPPIPPYQQPPQPYYHQQPAPPHKNGTVWKVLTFVFGGILAYIFITYIFTFGMLGCTGIMMDELSYTEDNNTYYIGDTAESSYLSYTLTDTEYLDEYAGHTAKEGYKLIEATFTIENISNDSEYLDYDITCYADDIMCNEIYSDLDTSYYSSGELLPDKTYIDSIVFEVPVDADRVTIAIDDYYSVKTFEIE